MQPVDGELDDSAEHARAGEQPRAGNAKSGAASGGDSSAAAPEHTVGSRGTAGGVCVVIEIGGTKLQWGLSDDGGRTVTDGGRAEIDRSAGAAGILRQLAQVLPALVVGRRVQSVGVGFGGPVDPCTGVALTSHQVAGWDNFPLADWCEQLLGVPARVINDCNAAALAEARWGAGQGSRRVFYVTVGTGIGGGWVVDGELDGADRLAVAEIGHLRPGVLATDPHETVESWASGLGMVRRAQQMAAIEAPVWQTVQELTVAAAAGDVRAQEVWRNANRHLGWAIGQVITLLAPDIVVIGGGVPQAGDRWFWTPVAQEVARYAFPPLAGTWRLAPAQLGDLVVLHGAACM